MQICVTKGEYLGVLEHAHLGIPRGHLSTNIATKTIVQAGLWWPALFQDAKTYVKRCNACHQVKAPIHRDEMPLRPMMGARDFSKWAIDLISPIGPLAMMGARAFAK